MRRNLLAVVLLLTMPSVGMAADEVVNDNFEDQAEGHKLDELVNWKYFAGWIKPEDGRVTVENGNKFLRMHGDVFARDQFTLKDKLTFRFKIRATGTGEELGGFVLHPPDGKNRYDVLFNYKRNAVSLARDVGGKRDTLGKADVAKGNVFQDVVVMLDRVANGVQFTVSVDGTKAFEALDTEELPLLKANFRAGFFTYKQATIDIDDVLFTQGN